jgi:hypothetical protein
MTKTITVTFAALLMATATCSAQQGPGPARGSEAGRTPATTQKQADCRRQADEKGLMGPSKRNERRSFMQSCVHGL